MAWVHCPYLKCGRNINSVWICRIHVIILRADYIYEELRDANVVYSKYPINNSH